MLPLNHMSEPISSSESELIGVVDNDELTLMTLSHYLQTAAHVRVWSATLASAALTLCRDTKTRPNLLLVDMSLTDMEGDEAICMLRASGCTMPILAVTSFPLHIYAKRAADSGAQGIVSKRSLKNILAAVTALLGGTTWDLEHDITFQPVSKFKRSAVLSSTMRSSVTNGRNELSAREETVIKLFSEGYTSEQAATRLGVSVNTIKTYSTRLCDKLGAHTRAQAVAKWMQSQS